MPVSIISCNYDRTTPDLGTFKVEKGNGQVGSYKLRYNIMMAGISGPMNVWTQAQTGSPDPAPKMWDTYSFQGDTDAHSFCKSVAVDRDPKHNYRYYLTATFEPCEPGEIPDGGGSPIMSVVNPVLRKPVYWWDREIASRVEAVDQSGRAIRNAANNLYEELVEHERARGLLVVQWNLSTIDELVDLSREYDQAVNSHSWSWKERVFPDRTVMVRSICGGTCKTEGAYTYYPVSMRLAFADVGQTWDVWKPEMGQTHFVRDGTGAYVSTGFFRQRVDAGSIVPLNPDGTRREDGAEPVVTPWRVRREADFSSLPFIAIT